MDTKTTVTLTNFFSKNLKKKGETVIFSLSGWKLKIGDTKLPFTIKTKWTDSAAITYAIDQYNGLLLTIPKADEKLSLTPTNFIVGD